MNDEDLSKYVPSHGDRVRLRHFFKQKNQETKSTSKKQKLLDVLREKVESQRAKKGKIAEETNEAEDMRRVNGQPGNKNACKRTRTIELGWIHKPSESESKYVRSNKGGGTRKIKIAKSATKREILEESKKLFFPHGVSKKGRVRNFDLDVWDIIKIGFY